jgi:hypothetical protein
MLFPSNSFATVDGSQPDCPNMPPFLNQGERKAILGGRSYPDDDQGREQWDLASQTPMASGNVLCWRRRRQCTNRQCKSPTTGQPYRFKAEDHELWNCPLCGSDRHCRKAVKSPNNGCKYHGGATPHGWKLPQTKTGQYSQYIKDDVLRADFEQHLASPQLFDVTEHIAFTKVMIGEIMGEYGGGGSRQLFQEMKKIRAAYKRNARKKEPDLDLARQLQGDLDRMISEGSQSRQVTHDYHGLLDVLVKAIDAHYRHTNIERTMITSDKAWRMLVAVEQTLVNGLEMTLEVSDERVLDLLRLQKIEFDAPLTPDRVHELKLGLRADQETINRKVLSYARKRFNELAGNDYFRECQ